MKNPFTPCKDRIIFAKEFILPFQGAIWNMALFPQPVGIGLGYMWFSTIQDFLFFGNFCNFFEKLYLCIQFFSRIYEIAKIPVGIE